MAVRIRSLTKQTREKDTELHLLGLGNAIFPQLGKQPLFILDMEDKPTLFWDGLILYFSLPVDTQSCESVRPIGNFRSE